MRTAKQQAASRANGQKSQGAVTAQGKANSRYNALKHGIYAESQVVFDETAEDLAELAAELHHQYSPADPTQRFLVDTLIHNEWHLRRLRNVEADLWDHAAQSYVEDRPELQSAGSSAAFTECAPAFERLQRIVNCCERNYHRALKELHRLIALGPAVPAEQAAQPEQSTTTSASPGSFQHSSETPQPEAPQTQFRHSQEAPTPVFQPFFAAESTKTEAAISR
jgi:hypothetical protein